MATKTTRTSPKPLVISYLRFSTPEQEHGDSARRQTDGAEKWAAERGLQLSERLEDRGISGYRGRNATEGALAEFLKLVRAGTVPPGSILIVEDLDRLSRQVPEDALEQFLAIIRSGVVVVTLIDGNEYRRGQLDMQRLMVSVMRICLAHEESAKKAMRLGKAWADKREALEAGELLTSRLPSWLHVVDGKVAVNEPKAGPIRRMFQMVLEGRGTTRIAASLKMGRSYVSKCLHNRQVIGEFQPHKLTYDTTGQKRRQAAGKTIRGYYPAIVDEPTFLAVQRMMASRKFDTGPATKFVNIFKGLIYNATDGSTMLVVNKGGPTGRQYVSAAAFYHKDEADEYIVIPIAAIEEEILGAVALAADIAPANPAPVSAELAEVETQFAEITSQINKLSAALATVGNVVAVVETIAKLEKDKDQLEKRRDKLLAEVGHAQRLNTGTDADEVRRLFQKYKEAIPGLVAKGLRMTAEAGGFDSADLDDRERLRVHVRQIVKRIDIQTVKKGHTRTARWTITMRDGQKLGDETTFHTRSETAIAQTEQARNLWRQAVRPVVIASKTGLSVSQVYRVCVGIKREGEWKPASRWDKDR